MGSRQIFSRDRVRGSPVLWLERCATAIKNQNWDCVLDCLEKSSTIQNRKKSNHNSEMDFKEHAGTKLICCRMSGLAAWRNPIVTVA